MWDLWGGSRRRQEQATVSALTALVETAKAMAEASQAQARALEAHMKLFTTVPEGPSGWVNRDEDMYLAELERQGFPVHGTDAEKLRWVQDNAPDSYEQLYELRPVSS